MSDDANPWEWIAPVLCVKCAKRTVKAGNAHCLQCQPTDEHEVLTVGEDRIAAPRCHENCEADWCSVEYVKETYK